MDYPFIFGNTRCGTLSIEHEGAYSVFRINAKGIGSDILRISVYGEGREFYLGIGEVQNGKMYFVKKLSRASMSGIPEKIEFASESGRACGKTYEPQKHTAYKKCADGALLLHDESGDMLALPTTVENVSGNCRIKIIEGRRYMLFRY